MILTLATVAPMSLQAFDTPIKQNVFASELSKEEHQEKWNKYYKNNSLLLPEGYFSKVQDTTQSPYQSVGSIFVKGKTLATASVVGKNKIITNYHIARQAENDPSKIIFRPGQTKDDQGNVKNPFGEFEAKSIEEAPFGQGTDLAIVTLKPNKEGKEVGDVVKPLTFGNGDAVGQNQVLHLVGFPYNTVQHTMYKQRIEVHSTQGALKYFGYTEVGNSGSPIFDDNNEIIGIHIGKSMIEGKGNILIGKLFDNAFAEKLKEKLAQ